MERKEKKINLTDFFAKKRQAKEVPPEFFDHLILVADDEEYFSERTVSSIGNYLREFPEKNVGIKTPKSLNQLVELSLVGKSGNQADTVLIDQSLTHLVNNWKHNVDELISLCEKHGYLFPKTKTNRQVPSDITENYLNLSILRGDGSQLALILRLAGFNGGIFVMSNTEDPWKTKRTNEIYSDMHESIPDVDIKMPIINRTFSKAIFTSNTLNDPTIDILLENPKK